MLMHCAEWSGDIKMKENILVKIIDEGLSVMNSSVSTMVGALMTSLFITKNNEKKELAKIKAGNFADVLNGLYDDGKISLVEYYKCSNFLKIAKLADKILGKDECSHTRDNYEKYSFDWFLKFYDHSGYIGNDKAQKLWAAVLANEIQNPNSTPLSLVHSLSIMSQEQAKFFCNISRFVLLDYKDNFPHLFIFVSSNRAAYMNSKITPEALRELERLGLVECDFEHEYIFMKKKMFKMGNNIITVHGDPNNDSKIKAGNVNFTSDGKLLYSIIDDKYKRYRSDILNFIIERFKIRNCSIVINDRKII